MIGYELAADKMMKFKDETGLTRWQCTDCQYIAKDKSNVFKHIERVHLNLSYSCPICGALFRSRANLTIHMKKH